MLWKIKNFLFNLCKKKTILFVFFFIFLGLAYPKVSSAFIVELAKKIAIAPLYYIIYVIVRIAVYIAGFAGSLLNWILSPNFISYSYTNPGGANPNPVIKTGLAVTQGFANMFLVLILVYIAIATILQLADYRTKRILVIFIVVALLVNFSPVICGLIVDASNIIMNFFVQDLSVDTFSETMGARVAKMNIGYWVETEPGPVSRLVQLAVLVPFLFVLTFILLILAVIFILRYIAIWLLVILSPMAFICYILPITKKYFDLWWKQFLNWCFIGVTCGFFLYLALFFVMQLETSPGAAISTPDIPSSDAPFNAILPYFVAVVFLGMGLVFGLATSAMGASTAISLTKRGQKASAKWVGGKIAQKGIRPLLEKARTKEAVGHIAKVVEKVPVARWFLPEKARLYGQMKPAVEKAQTQAKAYSSQTLAHRLFKGADTQTDALGDLIEILERGDGQDIFNGARKLKKFKGKSDEELLNDDAFIKRLVRPLNLAQKSGLLTSKVLRKDPRLAKIAAKTSGPNKIKGYVDLSGQEAVKKVVGEARSQHIASWEPEVFEDKDVIQATLGKFDRERWLQINRTIKNGQEKSLEGIDKAFSDFVIKQPKFKAMSKSDIANKLKDKDSNEFKEAWNDFREHIKTQNEGLDGYFKALEDKRVRDTGWREANFKIKDEGGKPPTAPTAGAAAMGGPPPTPPKQPDIPRTGRQGKKASNIPTTGKGDNKKEVKPKKRS